jgi:hypothetical protein
MSLSKVISLISVEFRELIYLITINKYIQSSTETSARVLCTRVESKYRKIMPRQFYFL